MENDWREEVNLVRKTPKEQCVDNNIDNKNISLIHPINNKKS